MAHFAVFPEKLIERPIKTTPRWICNKCGKPRVRITNKETLGRKGKADSIQFVSRYDPLH